MAGLIKNTIALAGLPLPASASPSRQEFQSLHCRLRVDDTLEDFTDPVGVGAQHLNNIGVSDALMSHDVCGYRVAFRQALALYFDIVQLNPGNGVLGFCHRIYLSLAIAAKAFESLRRGVPHNVKRGAVSRTGWEGLNLPPCIPAFWRANHLRQWLFATYPYIFAVIHNMMSCKAPATRGGAA